MAGQKETQQHKHTNKTTDNGRKSPNNYFKLKFISTSVCSDKSEGTISHFLISDRKVKKLGVAELNSIRVIHCQFLPPVGSTSTLLYIMKTVIGIYTRKV